MVFHFRFNQEKNEVLKATRGVSFEDILVKIREKKVLADIDHPNSKRSNQKVYLVAVDNYVYVVPYVLNKQKQEIFLKTLYPSRVFTKKYLREEVHEKTEK